MKTLINLNKITMKFRQKIPFDPDDLEKELNNIGIKTPSTQNSRVISISTDGSQSMAYRWEIENIEILYDPQRSFLSSEGKSIEYTSKYLIKLVEIAKKLIDTEFTDEIVWTEINCQLRVIGNEIPLNSISKKIQNKGYEEIGKILNTDVKPFGISCYWTDETEFNRPLNEIENWIHLGINPLSANAKYYVINFVYRKKNINDIISIASQIDKKIIEIIETIEND